MTVTCYFHNIRHSLSSRLTLKQCICLGIFVTVVIVTYIETRMDNNSVSNVINNSSHVMTSSKRFIYSNGDVYNTIMEIRSNNCVQKYTGKQTCSKLRSCEKLSESVSECGSLCPNSLGLNETEMKLFRYCKRRLPRAIIIGTYKSGTRELIDFLAMNPLVVIKRHPKYEVAYFDKHADKGLDWYKDAMPLSSEDQVTIEKSPSYITSQQAPRRIYEMDKNIKLILIVRNPAERTVSHLTFENFILKEQYGNSINNCLYKRVLNRRVINQNCFAVKSSFYDTQVERYLKYFPLKQIFIINADSFMKNPCMVMKDLEDFLEVDNFIDCGNFLYNNDTGLYCVRRNTNSAVGFCYGRTRGRLQLQTTFSALKDQLKILFKPHNERFFKLIHKRFYWE